MSPQHLFLYTGVRLRPVEKLYTLQENCKNEPLLPIELSGSILNHISSVLLELVNI